MRSSVFVDIHSHILPGVDDGGRDFEESLLMIREAVEIGVRECVLTPHVSIDSSMDEYLSKIADTYEAFKGIVAEREIDMDLHLGCEIMLHPDLAARVKEEKRLTVNGKGKCVLVEMPAFQIPVYASSVFFGLLANGVTPVWAHPERCLDVIRDHSSVLGYVNNGVKLQVNAGSILGIYGWRVKWAARSLIKKGLAHVISSDAHGVNHLRERLPKAFLRAAKLVGEDRAREMFFSNPLRVIGKTGQ